ncbi:MAG: hypothetical protein JXB07_08925 [Anaerolineae bacterium]|nr:hypothetical protein [Anaerolineae bacterium]
MAKTFLSYFWGVIVCPQTTFDKLAAQPTICWAVMAAALGPLQVWGNILLFSAFGFDWLGTRRELPDPTFVGMFGYVQVDTEHWVLIFAGILPLISLMGLVVVPGLTHLLSKLWNGQGTFEQMVNAVTFALVVPNIAINATSEWLFGVPINLIARQSYFWTSAMYGELGPTVGLVWNIFVYGIYLGLSYAWTFALGMLAIQRIERVPAWAAAVIMTISWSLWMMLNATFVR